jgi:hypothetical protein
MTLDEAKQWLRGQVKDGGALCPCCNQFAKIYRRNIHGAMAHWLILLYKKSNLAAPQFMHVRQVSNGRVGDYNLLEYWGLVEHKEVEASGKKTTRTSGIWRITPRGIAFVERRISVHKYIYIYATKELPVDEQKRGGQVFIDDCLKKKFNYPQLMAATTNVEASLEMRQ